MNSPGYNFCPRCSGRLELREIKDGEPERLVCEACGFIFYQGPKLVAATIFELNGGILLTQRAIEPGYGKWTFPGGFVERGERAEAAAEREALEEAGVEMNGRAIKVNSQMQTNLPGVYAAGDAIGGIMLAHVAWEESKVAVSNMLGKRAKMEYLAVPSCVFSTPELASVGLTEAEAKDQGYETKIGRFPFSASGRAVGMGEPVGMVKMVSEAGSGEILGTHILGPHASDLIAESVIAIEMGATAEDLDLTIHAHPTLPEAVQEAALGTTGKMIHYMGR